jgi:hypothetical protein
MLIPFLRNILRRPYSNFSFEVMTLLAGSLERSDTIFTVCLLDSSSISWTEHRDAGFCLFHRPHHIRRREPDRAEASDTPTGVDRRLLRQSRLNQRFVVSS